MKSISESIIGRKENTVSVKFRNIPGEIKWKFINRTAYSIDIEESSNHWCIMDDDKHVFFWAPGVEWCPCFRKDQLQRHGEIFWFIIENDISIKHPQEAYDIIMSNISNYISDFRHCIEFLDEIEFPDIVTRYLRIFKII